MDKEKLVSEQINRVPSDALNTPSKEQEQMQETSSQVEHNPNNNVIIKTYTARIYPFQM